jgi:mannose-6-phosphate isomerase-like protein (cupin superfamily)
MALPGQILVSPTSGERVIFRKTAAETNGELLELDFMLKPGDSVIATHIHPRQREEFDVVDGTFALHRERAVVLLGPGDSSVVAAGTSHRLRNAGSTEARAVVRFRPALDTEGLFELLFALAAQRVSRPKRVLTLAARITDHPDEIYLAHVPVTAQKLLARTLTPLARACGCNATEDSRNLRAPS